jgi:hypothetical protein
VADEPFGGKEEWAALILTGVENTVCSNIIENTIAKIKG